MTRKLEQIPHEYADMFLYSIIVGSNFSTRDSFVYAYCMHCPDTLHKGVLVNTVATINTIVFSSLFPLYS